jgi:EAL domain-containing protein (putative c-di-GMP-specific phosphodiesterase class I)
MFYIKKRQKQDIMILPTIDLIDAILENESIVTYFQPLVSLRKNSIVGFEALARGIHPATQEIVPPHVLFSQQNQDKRLELDRLCRRKALSTFSTLAEQKQNFLLSLNFDSSLVDRGIVGSGNLIKYIQQFNLDPNQIVIEILESKVHNISALDDFVRLYKSYGFLIALDDIGAGHSNLDRLAQIKPDIVKIDRNLIHNIDQEYYKQEVVKALINLSHQVGAIVIAEGVEEESEVITSVELGADLLQGYYFSHPTAIQQWDREATQTKIHWTSARFRTAQIQKVHQRQKRRRRLEQVITPLLARMKSNRDGVFEPMLAEFIQQDDQIECIYVLDEFGVQVSETICRQECLCQNKQLLFKPAPKGSDQSLKEYYLLINAGLKLFVSETYVSLASGNKCITLSKAFETIANKRYIFCVDIYPESLGS